MRWAAQTTWRLHCFRKTGGTRMKRQRLFSLIAWAIGLWAGSEEARPKINRITPNSRTTFWVLSSLTLTRAREMSNKTRQKPNFRVKFASATTNRKIWFRWTTVVISSVFGASKATASPGWPTELMRSSLCAPIKSVTWLYRYGSSSYCSAKVS